MSIDGKVVRFSADIDWVLLLSSGLLLILGIIALYSIERIQIATMGYSDVSFKSQLVYSILGIIAGIIAYRMRLRFLRIYAPYFLYLAFLLLIVTFFWGSSSRGGVRWLRIGGISIQTSDIARLALILYISNLFTKEYIGWNLSTFKALIIICVTTCMVLLQPDYGSAMITFLTSLLIMFSAGMPLPMFLSVFISSAFLGYKLIFTAPYRERRFLAFLDPWKDQYGDGYQYIQALRAFARGGLVGVGLGMGQQKLNILPEIHTDLILAHIGEELGFVTTIFVVFLYSLMCIRMFRIALYCPFRFSKLVVLGFALSLTIQAIINIGGVVKLLPLTGVPLPLLSSGGTSRIVSLFMVGYALGVSRYKSEVEGV
ncbi:FtsW/RodA/SpoVE family cell cycle protein [bacterium]|nr:FtsW/RodA/SpoVE family cell cycle protein [bacterium]